jgi:molybdate transport system ATP-binding protein
VSLTVDAMIEIDEFVVEIAFTVERGETVALVGPNGAGKSTVLRAIAGLHPISSGRVAFGDQVWDEPSTGVFVAPRNRQIGAVFQNYLLFEHLSALDNVAFGLRARRADKRRARLASQSAMERLGVGAIAEQMPSTLSGGQAQRVALARALVIEPGVVVLDEPLAALDATTRGTVRHDLPAWLGESRSADGLPPARIVVTHDPVDAHALADRVVVLEAGRITQTGTPGDLAARPRSTFVADLMGTNVLHGLLRGSVFDVHGGGELIVGAHDAVDGPAIAAIRPAAVSLHRSQPEGSPRNVWETRVAGIDRSNDRVRVRLGAPSRLVVEVTEAGLAALDVSVDARVWSAVKASEISVVADG